MLAFNTVLVSFSEPLATAAINFSKDSYTITGLTVRKVLQPLNTTAPTEVILETDPVQEGIIYTVSAAGLISASTTAFNDAITVFFEGMATKLDKVLTNTQFLYDTTSASIVRQILTAIHREDNKIGGSGS